MQGEERFPDGYTGVQGASITRSRALSRAESMGVHADAHEDEKLQSISAKERWENRLDSITVQTLARTEAKPRRDAKVRRSFPCLAIKARQELHYISSRREQFQAIEQSMHQAERQQALLCVSSALSGHKGQEGSDRKTSSSTRLFASTSGPACLFSPGAWSSGKARGKIPGRWTSMPMELEDVIKPLTASVMTQVVLLTPPCCRGISQDEEIVSSCNRRLMSECSALDDVTCYLGVAAQPPCNVLETFQYSYRDS